MSINEGKLKHILGVARRCYELAKERGYDDNKAKRMFMLGWVHDIGYEFCEDYSEHAKVSNELLKLLGAEDNLAVLNHGNPNIEIDDIELEILNIADFTVNHLGNRCTVEERLNGIADRYGEDSESYKNARVLAEKLGLITFDKNKYNILSEDNVALNSNCVNKKIKANILSDDKMRAIGFTDFSKDTWYFTRTLGFDITFNVAIPKNGSDIRIDVLDERFCQPYDYQRIITNALKRGMEPNKTAMTIFKQVENWMECLAKHGVIEGHVYGEYI